MNNDLSLMERFADPVLFEELSKSEIVQGSLITTLMGMGITFVVLTLLWGMIALMTKVLNTKTDTGSSPKAAPVAAPSAVQVATAPTAAATTTIEAEANNAELIAVITAAIAAMEENTSTSSLIVRKISRISGNVTTWSRAGSADCIESRKF